MISLGVKRSLVGATRTAESAGSVTKWHQLDLPVSLWPLLGAAPGHLTKKLFWYTHLVVCLLDTPKLKRPPSTSVLLSCWWGRSHSGQRSWLSQEQCSAFQKRSCTAGNTFQVYFGGTCGSEQMESDTGLGFGLRYRWTKLYCRLHNTACELG